MAPNLFRTETNGGETGICQIGRALRCHEPCEIGRRGAYFDDLPINYKRERDSLAERGGFEPPVPRGLLWARIRPEFGEYSARQKAYALERICSSGPGQPVRFPECLPLLTESAFFRSVRPLRWPPGRSVFGDCLTLSSPRCRAGYAPGTRDLRCPAFAEAAGAVRLNDPEGPGRYAPREYEICCR